MGTGYTAGILNGSIKTFKQFATQCIRAFGGAIHMRDDDWDAPYRPDEVDEHYVEQVKECEEKIEKLSKLSNDELIEMRKNDLIDDKNRYLKYIKDKEEAKIKLEVFLAEANNYVPPTSEHQGIKDFMIQQLTDTIKWDGDASYYEKEVEKLNKSLENIDPYQVRKELMEDAIEDLSRQKRYLAEEVSRVNSRNEWSKQYLESLKNLK